MAAVALGVAAIGAIGTAAAAPPAMAAPVKNDAWGMFDNSGWTVATGSATASATRTTGAELSDVQRMLPWIVLGAVAIVVAKAWGRK